ncbi:DUF167 family protein YggU [Ferrimonas marina]|uniref:UPF0235 protein SAMN02745129_4105 n=1 Tax=Ferrimonas marina TaxID=299255 RepID=A0A1M5YD75_9GAMM|nr:DUF167 family protein YggU [Ferrimonas marina]SHI09995.1 hypothetical protein SAMN02745129_4105 [Ferrimonas marina]
MSQAVRQQGESLLLNLYIQPKASRDALVGEHGDEFKVAITAPPVDGKANSHLIKYLAKQFKVAKGQITIVKGELGRHKQLRIDQPKAIPSAIEQLLNH